MDEVRYLVSIRKKLEGKTVCLFPMGIGGKFLYDKLLVRGMDIDFFCDNNEKLWGTEYKGKKCISVPELLAMDQGKLLVIIESSSYLQIKKQLMKCGIKNLCRIYYGKAAAEEYVAAHDIKKDVESVLSLCADNKSREVYQRIINSWLLEELEDDYFSPICSDSQYFDESVFKLKENEVYVDCGAYTGDSAEAFLSACNGQYEKMHLFELDPEIYKSLCKEVPQLHERGSGLIQCYPYGVSNENAELKIISGNRNSEIDQEGNRGDTVAKIKKLDNVLLNDRVSIIKMDIEGAELDALDGSRRIIKRWRPALAICIYHSPRDMLKIPQYIKELAPEYKIYIRHYTDLLFETVCYGVPPERYID